MTKTFRSARLETYATQQIPRLHPTSDLLSNEAEDSNTTVEHHDGLICVDAIRYPYIVVGPDDEIITTKPVTMTTFLIGYDPDFEHILDVVREHLEASKLVNLNKYEYNGIRLPNKGPVLAHAAWAQIGSQIKHVEAIIDLPVVEKQRLHRQYQYESWAWIIVPAMCVIGPFLLAMLLA